MKARFHSKGKWRFSRGAPSGKGGMTHLVVKNGWPLKGVSCLERAQDQGWLILVRAWGMEALNRVLCRECGQRILRRERIVES